MTKQFIRKASLQVINDNSTVDLSQLRFQFKTANADTDSPNNCSIRVFNTSAQTVQKILSGSYTRVVVNAGYEGSYGVIFDGNIKQFKTGRLSNVDSFLDILAADADLAYNFSVNTDSVAAGTSKAQELQRYLDVLGKRGVTVDSEAVKGLEQFGGTIPRIRGKVLWGSTRVAMSKLVESSGCTWSIQNGKLQIIPLDGFKAGEAVELTAQTGLIGIPEQTADGITCRCLLNPRIVVGGRVHINNTSVNQQYQTNPVSGSPSQGVIFNSRTQLNQPLATVTADGFYRVYVAEHEGDTRGGDWYTSLVCLAVDSDTGKVKPYGRPA